jgi:predicted murein hydrolase (TIGR00659 family)
LREFLSQPWFGIAITLAVWIPVVRLCRRCRFPGANPVLITVILLMGLLHVGGIEHASYNSGARFLHFLLGPAVVAFAVPLYRQRRRISQKGIPIFLGILCGCFAGIITAAGTAILLGADVDVILSVAPKSATAPIAIGVVERLGGIPALAAGMAVATGILGGAIGPELLRLAGIRGRFAMGLAMGTAAHGIGTARVREEDAIHGDDVGEAFSIIGMTLNGIATAVTLPLLLYAFHRLC